MGNGHMYDPFFIDALAVFYDTSDDQKGNKQLALDRACTSDSDRDRNCFMLPCCKYREIVLKKSLFHD